MTGPVGILNAVSIGDILSLLVALGVVVAGLKWIRPLLQPLRDFTILLQGRPGYPGVPEIPSFSERLASVEKAAQEAAFHSQPNHGTSAYDTLLLELRGLRGIVTAHVEMSAHDRHELHREVNGLTADIDDLQREIGELGNDEETS